MTHGPFDFADQVLTSTKPVEVRSQQLTIADSFGATDAALRCPVCGLEYNHIQAVLSERHPDADEAPGPYRGTKDLVDDPRNQGRRAALRIIIACEGGHFWSLLLQQHKGCLYAYSRYEWQTADPEKVADNPVHEVTHRDVVLSSRYARRGELDVMRQLVDALPEPMRAHLRRIFCDSKANSVFTLDCTCSDTECELMLDNIEETLRVVNGGHNGLQIEGRDQIYRDPEWFEAGGGSEDDRFS